MRASVLFLSASLLATAATAQAQNVRLDPRDVQRAAQEHQAVIAEFGGAETGARGQYVQQVGNKIAAYSGVVGGNQRINFTTLNSAVDNAFAVPGGYVYITRQLMTLMNDEAELAFVLGHEAGHIAANHSQKRQSAAQKNGILGIFGAIIGSVVGGGIGDLIGQASQQFSQFNTLKYSRNQEMESDRLGMNYMIRAGYDPAGAPEMLAALGRSSALQARIQGRDQRSLPEWASTHPLSSTRVAATTQLAQQSGRLGQGVKNEDTFLRMLEGVTVDDDPAQGIIDGRSFIHPDLKLAFAVPTGYQMQNGTRAVQVEGSAGKAQFTTVPGAGNINTYLTNAVRQLTGGQQSNLRWQQLRQTTINGIPTIYTSARSGNTDAMIFVYQFAPNQWFHFVTLTQAGRGAGPFTSMINSVRRISATEAANIRPRVIDVHTVKAGETTRTLAARMAYRSYQYERFMSLNGLAPNAALVPGQKVKLVVYGTQRS